VPGNNFKPSLDILDRFIMLNSLPYVCILEFKFTRTENQIQDILILLFVYLQTLDRWANATRPTLYKAGMGKIENIGQSTLLNSAEWRIFVFLSRFKSRTPPV
jgi:hypothetical protein